MKTIIIFVILFLTQVTIAQIPEWYTSHTDAKYPPTHFIIGVGSAGGENGIEVAKKNALADIVSQMRVQVQSEVKGVEQSFQMNNDEQIYSDFKKQTRTVVSEEITGAEIAETAVDPTTHTAYALAVLNRATYCQGLGSELSSGWKQASDLRVAAKDYLDRGRLTEAIQSIQQVRQVIAPLIAKQVLYNAVAGSPFQSEFVFNPNVLQEDIRSFLSMVKIEKIGGDKQEGKIGKNFQQPLEVRVLLKAGDTLVPCSGVPVDFVYNDNTLLGERITDEHGQAALITVVRPLRGNGIRARLAISGLGRGFEKNIAASSVNFTWTALPSDRKFVLSVVAKSRKVMEAVRSKFLDAITEAGYTVAPVANYILAVDVQSGIPQKVEGFSGTICTMELTVSVTLTERKSNTVLGSAIFTAQGVGKLESEAEEKAAENLIVGEKEISDLLGR